MTATLSSGAINNWQVVTKATLTLTTDLKLNTGASNGGRFVIMGEGGTELWLTNGGWRKQLPDLNGINDVLWNGTQWYAVADAGDFSQSTDGLYWTANSSLVQTTNDLNGIAWNGSRYVIVTDSARLLWSDDGATWTQVSVTCPTSGAVLTPAPSCDLMAVAWDAAGIQFIAVGSRGTLLRSTDTGAPWDPRAVGPVPSPDS